MKKNLLKLKLACLFGLTLFLGACQKEVEYNPALPYDYELKKIPTTFVVTTEQGEVTSSSAKLHYKVSDTKVPYVSVLLPFEVYSKTKPTDLRGVILTQLEQEAGLASLSLDAYLAKESKTGEQEVLLGGLQPGSTYAIVHYAYMAETGSIAELPSSQEYSFSTAIADRREVNFAITPSITEFNCQFTILPSDLEATYYAFPVEKTEYDKTLALGYTPEFLIGRIYSINVVNLVYRGVELDEAITQLLVHGEQTLSFDNLKRDTEYVLLVAGIASLGFGKEMVYTEVKEIPFSTLKARDLLPAALDFTYELDKNGDQDFATVHVVPEDAEMTWKIRLLKHNAKTINLSDEELAKYVVESERWFWFGPPIKGSRDVGSIYLEGPGRYFIIAFGHKGNQISNRPVVKHFTLVGSSNPEATSFTVNPEPLFPYYTKLKITPSDPYTYYAYLVAEDGTQSVDKLREDVNKDLKVGYEQWLKTNYSLEGDNAGLMKEYYLNSQFLKGANVVDVDELDPGKSYTVFIVTFYPDATIAKIEEKRAEFRTPQPDQSIQITPRVVAVVDGSQATEDMFGSAAAAAKGKAIVWIEYESQQAVTIGTYIVPLSLDRKELDTSKVPDKHLFTSRLRNGMMKQLPIEIGTAEYFEQFIICNWDEAQIAFYFGTNAAGNMSPLYRSQVLIPKRREVMSYDAFEALFYDRHSLPRPTTPTSMRALWSVPQVLK